MNPCIAEPNKCSAKPSGSVAFSIEWNGPRYQTRQTCQVIRGEHSDCHQSSEEYRSVHEQGPFHNNGVPYMLTVNTLEGHSHVNDQGSAVTQLSQLISI